MTPDAATLQATLGELLAERATLERLRAALLAFAASGGTREDAMAALERLRAEAPDENYEDRVLETMDIVAGFISPHMWVWPEPGR